MYEYLSGKLIRKTPTVMILETQGIGFEIHIPVSTFSALPEIGQQVKVLTHFAVREDLQALYGFYTEEEREIFRLLISISGIGPKSAMTVLSGISIGDLKRAIINGNLAVLTSIPGIGRKTAERLVIELREKIVVEEGRSSGASLERMKEQDERVDDSIRALVELGYRKQNAKEAVQKAVKTFESPDFSVPDLIRIALKHI